MQILRYSGPRHLFRRAACGRDRSIVLAATSNRHNDLQASRLRAGGRVLLDSLLSSSSQAQPLTHALLGRSLETYLDCTPSAGLSVAALVDDGHISPNTIAHDHFAYRTLGLPGLGIASLASVLHELGYVQAEEGLQFPAKKLTAAWFSHTSSHNGLHPLPRIFVSEIKVHELSPGSQAIIHKRTEGLQLGPAQVAVACMCGKTPGEPNWTPWEDIDKEDYDALLEESDYAAWVMAHGYALNHTALAVHRMRHASVTDKHVEEGAMVSLEDAARMVADCGLPMNQDGGLIKVSGDGLLRQCSTMSDPVKRAFATGGRSVVPGAYLELVERAAMPQFAAMQETEMQEWHRRDGFEVSNAAHLFTSTRA